MKSAVAALLLAVASVNRASGLVELDDNISDTSSLHAIAFKDPDLDVDDGVEYVTVEDLPANERAKMKNQLTRLGASEVSARFDQRGGSPTLSALIISEPLIPGKGVNNNKSRSNNGRGNQGRANGQAKGREAKSKNKVRRALRRGEALKGMNEYLNKNRADLNLLDVDFSEMLARASVTVHGENEDHDNVQFYMRRQYEGIPFRGSHMSAVVNSGNLVMLSTERWFDNDPDFSTTPTLTEDDANAALDDFVNAKIDTFSSVMGVDVPNRIGVYAKSKIEIIPIALGRSPAGKQNGGALRKNAAVSDDPVRYTNVLCWILHPQYEADDGKWEAIVDSQNGRLLAFQNLVHYLEVKGGVLPKSNDGIVPDGVEQAGWPMPFIDVSDPNGDVWTSDSGGFVASGSGSSSLEGPYVKMEDTCGPTLLESSDGVIDFGISNAGDTDCDTPGYGGSGNTRSSRTGFYELNRVREWASSHLPDNNWLDEQLTSNVNIEDTCNAFYSPSSGIIGFYKSGGGCFNTGELAGVIVHEWGHAMDDNDEDKVITDPFGEGVADIYTALRLGDSCIGRNFRSTPCTGNGDPCKTCTGVRDIDYLKRESENPHTYTWRNANCGDSVHCIGGVISEAVWSLWKRDLPNTYGYDDNTAHEIVTRLTFIAATATSTWFSGNPPYGGCSTGSAYMEYLSADDDNGDLSDGTPHMQAISDAFNRQEIACDTPSVQDSGCQNTPTDKPEVTVAIRNMQVDLSWLSVDNASGYSIFRTDGVEDCGKGKVKVADTITNTSFTDTGLQNDREYYYVVIPMGPAPSCFGPASNCITAVTREFPGFHLSCQPTDQVIPQGGVGETTCNFLSILSFTDIVHLSCSGNPVGIGCTFSQDSVTLPSDGMIESTLTINVDSGQALGDYTFTVEAISTGIVETSSMRIGVHQRLSGPTSGQQNAIYDSSLETPACATASTECDSNGLLVGRGERGPEPNYSNTLDACTDGNSGTYHSDESSDRIVVKTVDGFDFVSGVEVEIEATVWAWSTGSSDTADFYYTADANDPTWVHIKSLTPPSGGEQTLKVQYILPDDGADLQAVRVNFRYTGSRSSCSGGTYDDADDVVFFVDTNECSSRPCMHGGTCADLPGSYSCECSAGYTGVNCETSMDKCPATNPCMNGGTCVDGAPGSSFWCDCPADYAGDVCETDISECASQPCEHGGTCSNGANSYSCSCPPGYTGTNCETNIDECSSNPCLNGGICNDGVDFYSCSCTAGYMGQNCETQIAEGKGYMISTHANFVPPLVNQYSKNDIMHMKIWSETIQHDNMDKNEYEIKFDGGNTRVAKGALDHIGHGIFTGSRALNALDSPEYSDYLGEGTLKLKLQDKTGDKTDGKYEVKAIPIMMVEQMMPTSLPTSVPSALPTDDPSMNPSDLSSLGPSSGPSGSPSLYPSNEPSTSPSNKPSQVPSVQLSFAPSVSSAPSTSPSEIRSMNPSDAPSLDPSSGPSGTPSYIPSHTSSLMPSNQPTIYLSEQPSKSPSSGPSNLPSMTLSDVPSGVPSPVPSQVPSESPSSGPSNLPSVTLSDVPSGVPSQRPSQAPSGSPSSEPSNQPSVAISNVPSKVPSPMPSQEPGTQAAVGKGYMISNHANFDPTHVSNYLRSDTIYMKIWSDTVEYNNMDKQEYQIKFDRDKVAGGDLVHDGFGHFTASVDFADLEDKYLDIEGTVKLKLQDNTGDRDLGKYEERDITITVSAG